MTTHLLPPFGSRSAQAATLAAGILCLLAACGGRANDAPGPDEQRAALPALQVRIDAAVPAGAQVMAAAAAPGDDLAELRQQVAALRGDIAEMRLRLTDAVTVARSAEPARDPRSDPQAHIEAEQVELQRVATAETAFRSERDDGRWSLTTTATVRAVLAAADEPVRSQVRSVECRSQTCRVEIGAAALAQAAPDLPLMLVRLGQALPRLTAGQIDQGDGRQATVLYLSR